MAQANGKGQRRPGGQLTEGPVTRRPVRWAAPTSRAGWLVGGIVVLILISMVAWTNLQEIYESQKDFVVGALFSLAGFLLGKALGRTDEQNALLFIRSRSSGAVNAAVAEEAHRMLQECGAVAELQVLQRNVGAALGKLSVYFDTQARRLDSHASTVTLMMALEELDAAAANVTRLGRWLEDPGNGPDAGEHVVNEELALAAREIHAANDRRHELYELISKSNAGGVIDDDAWASYGVMSSDILRAARTLSTIRSRGGADRSADGLAAAGGYLAAALRRADEFRSALAPNIAKMPAPFKVMIDDLSAAHERVTSLGPSRKAVPT